MTDKTKNPYATKIFNKKFNAERAAKSAEKKGLHLVVVMVEKGAWRLELTEPPAPQPEPTPATAAADVPADVESALEGAAQAPAAKPRKLGKRAALEEAARRGVMPEPPDFSAKTHTRFRKKLAALVALAEAGDIEGLRNFHINPISTSPKAMDRYRNLCVMALEARAGANRVPAEAKADAAPSVARCM
jgi:hypothetical protein